MFDNPIAIVVVVVLVVLLFVGPKRLPMLSRSVGESVKEFKGGISDDKQEIDAAPSSTTSTTESTSETTKTPS